MTKLRKARVILRVVLSLAALALHRSPSQAQTQGLLKGSVLLKNGTPAAAAEVSRFWLLGTSDNEGARAYASTNTDASGRFSFALEQKDLPVTLMVYTANRKAAAVVQINAGTHEVRISLHPTSRVRLTADAAPLGAILNSPRFLLEGQNGATLAQLVDNNVIFPLPQGDYRFTLSSADTVTATELAHVPAQRTASFHYALKLGPMAEHYGKLPPQLTGLVDSQGHPFSLSRIDRPTLLYFWADWCQPCVSEGIPHLLDFAEAHRGERFQIIAIHQNGIPAPSTAGSFRLSLDRLQRNVWKRPLSFPFVFDSEGRSTSAWGLSTFPTYAFIDAHGILQRTAGLDEFALLLQATGHITAHSRGSAQSAAKPAQTRSSPRPPSPGQSTQSN